jgi:hypothetical protein
MEAPLSSDGQKRVGGDLVEGAIRPPSSVSRYLRPPHRQSNRSRQVYRHWEKPVNVALTSEMLELVRGGAAPVAPRDRPRYYNLVSASLRKCSLLTNAALMDAIRAAQRELLRPPAEAI